MPLQSMHGQGFDPLGGGVTDYVRLVRGTDAVLHARSNMRTLVRELAMDARSLEPADLVPVREALDRAVELVQPVGDPAHGAVAQARTAVEVLGTTPPAGLQPGEAVTAAGSAIDGAHATMASTIDAMIVDGAAPSAKWRRAGSLVRDGIELPDSFRRHGEVAVDTRPAAAADDALARSLAGIYDDQAAYELVQLRRLVDRLDEFDDDTASLLHRISPKELDRAARLVADGHELPDGWRAHGTIAQLRAARLWQGAAERLQRVREILWPRVDQVDRARQADLKVLRNLPDELRPEVLDRLAANLADSDPAALREARLELAGDRPRAEAMLDLRRAALAFEAHIEQPRERVLEQLQAVDEALQGYAALDLTPVERTIVSEAQELVERNLARQQGGIRDSYRSWTDLAELGRVRESTRLLDTIETTRQVGGQPGVPSTATAAVDDAPTAVAAERLEW